MTTLHVSCAAEGDYVQHSAAMLHSVLTHRGDLDVHIHYLHGPGLDSTDSGALTELVAREGGRISFLEVPVERLEGLPVDSRFTAAMWYRLFLPELAPEAARMLYLDVDTLACSSLEPLWDTDLRGEWLGAVTNAFQPNHLGRPGQLGLADPKAYFNSGVLLMDLELQRREGVTRALLKTIAERGSELEWPDQDALNLVMHPRRLALHPRWNSMNALQRRWSRRAFGPLERQRATRRPAIRHFEGPGANKPWHPDCAEPQRELYWEHLRQTPWAPEAR